MVMTDMPLVISMYPMASQPLLSASACQGFRAFMDAIGLTRGETGCMKRILSVATGTMGVE